MNDNLLYQYISSEYGDSDDQAVAEKTAQWLIGQLDKFAETYMNDPDLANPRAFSAFESMIVYAKQICGIEVD